MLNREITIDVVIPLYNGENTILRTLESVALQTLRPCHIIVVNDGSTDESSNQVRKFSAKMPNLILVETQNMGRSSARNTGISRTDSAYIAFIDADDEWLPNRLERAAEVIRDTKTKAYACDYLLRIGTETFHGRRNRKFAKISLKNLITQVAFIPGSASSAVIARSIISNNQLFPEESSFGEDLDAWCTIATLTEWKVDQRELVIIDQSDRNSNSEKPSAYRAQLSRLNKYPNFKWRVSSLNSLVYARSIDARNRIKNSVSIYLLSKNSIFDIKFRLLLALIGNCFRAIPALVFGFLIHLGYAVKYGRVTREKTTNEY